MGRLKPMPGFRTLGIGIAQLRGEMGGITSLVPGFRHIRPDRAG